MFSASIGIIVEYLMIGSVGMPRQPGEIDHPARRHGLFYDFKTPRNKIIFLNTFTSIELM